MLSGDGYFPEENPWPVLIVEHLPQIAWMAAASLARQRLRSFAGRNRKDEVLFSECDILVGDHLLQGRPTHVGLLCGSAGDLCFFLVGQGNAVRAARLPVTKPAKVALWE